MLRSYGLERDSALNQYLGAFEAREGRSIAFPNVYQHAVDAFRLVDPNKPGRRTIVAFFLCDPTYRILSTSDVPPQRADWLRRELQSVCRTSRIHNLVPELKNKIVDHLVEEEVVLERWQADEVRRLLMEERSNFHESTNGDIFEAGFK